MISVIVPVYNCGEYVERCITSITSQTYTDLEIICVNDGSTDNSGEILDNLSKNDSRIKVIHQKNAGVSTARNVGIDNAKGDFLTFVDSDDAIESDMYEILMSYFDDENIDIVHCGYKRVHSDGTFKEVNGTKRCVCQNKYEASECLLLGKMFVGSLCNKVYRASLFNGVRLDKLLKINEDILMNAELFIKSNKIVFIDIGKYLMYEREGSATSGTNQLKSLTDCESAADKMVSLFENTPVEIFAKERLLNCRLSLYRWYVMNDLQLLKKERGNLETKIDSMLNSGVDISSKQKINYKIMRFFPSVYGFLYKFYNKIRVPNWDVSSED